LGGLVSRAGRLVALAVAIVVIGAGAGWALSSWGDAVGDRPGTASAAAQAPDPASAAVTSLPGLTPATGEPVLPGLTSARPAPGTVGRVPGPFDDRFDLSRLALGPTAVTGLLTVTSDVSDLLELQVLAGFYDGSGALVGTARFTHHLGGQGHSEAGPPDQQESFSIAIPQGLRSSVAAAAVGVPVLVNE
jgi:hypothetical protein